MILDQGWGTRKFIGITINNEQLIMIGSKNTKFKIIARYMNIEQRFQHNLKWYNDKNEFKTNHKNEKTYFNQLWDRYWLGSGKTNLFL